MTKINEEINEDKKYYESSSDTKSIHSIINENNENNLYEKMINCFSEIDNWDSKK